MLTNVRVVHTCKELLGMNRELSSVLMNPWALSPDLMRLAFLPDVLQDLYMGGLSRRSRYASSFVNVTLTISDSVAENAAEALVLHLQHLDVTLDGGVWVVTNMILELYQTHLHSELLVLDELLVLSQPLHGIGGITAWSQPRYLAAYCFLMFMRAAEEDMDADCWIRTEDRSIQVHNDRLVMEVCAGRHVCDLASGDNRSELSERVDLEIGDQVDPQGKHQFNALSPGTSTGSTGSWPYPV